MVAHAKPVIGGLALIALIIFVVPTAQAETEIKDFLPTDTFSMPDYNSSIRFATNGSYLAVTLVNGVWNFTGLKLGFSRNTANISVSAKNCNMTILSVSASNFSARSVSMRYTVNGIGSQSVCFLDIPHQTSSVEWSVIVPGESGGRVWLSEGQNWNLLPNNTVVVHDIIGNVTVSRFNFGNFPESNLPFHLQHSVTIITAAVLIALVAAALVIKLAVRRK